MPNSFTSNPILLDTFTGDVDIGNTVYGDSNHTFPVEHIEWQTPTTVGHSANVTNGEGIEIFSEVCAVATQSIFKPFRGAMIKGIKVSANAVASGKISILLGRK